MSLGEALALDTEESEDYYEVLGCDPSSNNEQIIAEFKIKAKEFHPGKARKVKGS